SFNTLAVIDISAMPPGAVARIIVGIGKPPSHASEVPTVADSSNVSAMPATAAVSMRGARSRKSRSSRQPIAQPIRHWPAFESNGGIDEKLKPDAVTITVHSSGPSIQGVGAPIF